MRDAALEEIRATRRRIWEGASGMWEGYASHLDEVEAELRRLGAKIVEKPHRRPLEPEDSAIVREGPPAT